jgi:exodeoxyribonuclease VII large subunit
MAELRVYSLSALNESIRKLIAERTGKGSFWIRAEIAQYNVHGSGHVYLDLAEEREGRLLAKAQAVIWQADYQNIINQLGEESARVLRRGSEIQCRVEVNFHVVHGLKLIIREVDLSFNLGQVEKRKQETLAQLKKAGLLKKNAALKLPVVVQRIALFGAADSAGFADFVRHLRSNEYGYCFELMVFPSRVQGEGAAAALVLNMQELVSANQNNLPDAVILVRGGGSRLDLDVFNDLLLAETIARFPVPVLTGIGHETDRTVADEVAHTASKTPTAVAAFLLDRAAEFESDQRLIMERVRYIAVKELKAEKGSLSVLQEGFGVRVNRVTERKRSHLQNAGNRIARTLRTGLSERGAHLLVIRSRIAQRSTSLLKKETPALLQTQKHQLSSVSRTLFRQAQLDLVKFQSLSRLTRIPLQQSHQKMESFAASLRFLHPENVLNKGYAILKMGEKVWIPDQSIVQGEKLDIVTKQFKITAIMDKIEKRIPLENQF